MPSITASTGLTITNPLVLYRALLTTKHIEPDPAQHRLALHLQKLYYRLKDYQPEVDFNHRLDQLNRIAENQGFPKDTEEVPVENTQDGQRKGIFASLRRQRKKTEAMALTRRLTNHESAINLRSPQGLLLYGEVGTGKSFLVDLLADCLPNRKKRRWHFNTFMLETFARLEQLRKSRLSNSAVDETRLEEHSLLWLARDMISTSPVLFLDEFQLPDRAASKILSNLLTSFFHLGGVLIATSNRMPEELANASGVEFGAPPSSRLGLFGNRWGLLGSQNQVGRSENMFAGKGDFAAFLEVLRARCEVWDMEGGKDWRRREAVRGARSKGGDETGLKSDVDSFQGFEPMATGNWGLGHEQSAHVVRQDGEHLPEAAESSNISVPSHYVVRPPSVLSPDNLVEMDRLWAAIETRAIQQATSPEKLATHAGIPWESSALRVYGRALLIPSQISGVTRWTFDELCGTNLGPADYITLVSTFHTFVLTDVPIMTLLQKNEARRRITLLDAMYEARCKLLISAEAGPDELFFPESRLLAAKRSDNPANGQGTPPRTDDSVYSETFSEIYQDQTSPFRPNISSYTSSASPLSYDSSPLPSQSHNPARSILADEDSDFGPVSGAGRLHGISDGAPGAGNEIGRQAGPDFGRTGAFTGEDEKFAYKRASSRLWEMCGSRWWAREEEGWWRPLSREVRRWEGPQDQREPVTVPPVESVQAQAQMDDKLFRHGASPFRTSQEAPPKFGWVHAWGMMTWGKKAGVWGKGTDGLEERREDSSSKK